MFRVQFKYMNPDRSPIDLTGKTARMQVTGRTVLLDSKLDPGGITLSYDRPNGTIMARIGADRTSALSTGSFTYGIELAEDGDPTEVMLVASGSFTVNYDGVG